MDYSPPGSSVHGDSPGKNTGMGCRALLQGIFPTQGPNPGLPHCRQRLYCLSHQRRPTWFLSTCKNEIRVDETHSNNVVTYLHLKKLIKFFLFLTLKNIIHTYKWKIHSFKYIFVLRSEDYDTVTHKFGIFVQLLVSELILYIKYIIKAMRKRMMNRTKSLFCMSVQCYSTVIDPFSQWLALFNTLIIKLHQQNILLVE